jgi:Family of unknown function (DUF5990)
LRAGDQIEHLGNVIGTEFDRLEVGSARSDVSAICMPGRVNTRFRSAERGHASAGAWTMGDGNAPRCPGRVARVGIRRDGQGMAEATVRIVGYHLPGISVGPHTNVHIGIQRAREVIEKVAADAPTVEFVVPLDVRSDPDRPPDFYGPFAQGKRGARFVYLNWGAWETTASSHRPEPASAGTQRVAGGRGYPNSCSRS